MPRRYRFVHALTQEVAYQGMLGSERKHLHTALATRLATRAREPEENCEEIARHHLAGETPSLALPFLEAATAKAIRNHTLDAAHGYIVDAIRLFEAEEMTAERVVRCVVYLLQAFPVFHFLHKHREYAELLERYGPQVEALNEPAVLGPFLAQRGHREVIAGHLSTAKALLQRAVPMCEKANDPVYVLLPSRGMMLTTTPAVSASPRPPDVFTTTSCALAVLPDGRVMVSGGSSLTATPMKKNEPPQSRDKNNSMPHSADPMVFCIATPNSYSKPSRILHYQLILPTRFTTLPKLHFTFLPHKFTMPPQNRRQT